MSTPSARQQSSSRNSAAQTVTTGPVATVPVATVPVATVHVDLDGAQEIYEGHGWGYPYADDNIFESGMRHFLDFCGENDVRATLFVIARAVRDPRKRALLDEAVRAGHEIASHSLTHEYLTQLDLSGKRKQIAESRELLEHELGVPVTGFRAPGYRIDRDSLELLAECGYVWDSSVWPTAKYARVLGVGIESLVRPHCPVAGSDFVEWPMPDFRPFPLPFNPSYALVVGDWLFRLGLRRFHSKQLPLSLLFHLIDVADPLPRDRLRGLSSKIFTLSQVSAPAKRRRCQGMLDQVRAAYRIRTTGDAIAEWRGRGRGTPSAKDDGRGGTTTGSGESRAHGG